MRKGTWATIGVIVVIAAAVIIYAVTRNSSSTASNSYGTTTQTNKPKTQTSTSIVQTKTATNVGQYLADSNGNALYTYGADKTGVSNCTGSCLYSWPIYDASNAPASLPANVTVITRSDGGKQYAYKGMPLYTFTSDSSGQVTGDGVSNFHVAKP
ncbi:MAG TPA: hypothetical protein VFI84_02300 [Candidatus Saccharimonadales bacterium]|nr:hypothetical protein [Candidatus Saccharimonadales bacterium]